MAFKLSYQRQQICWLEKRRKTIVLLRRPDLIDVSPKVHKNKIWRQKKFPIDENQQMQNKFRVARATQMVGIPSAAIYWIAHGSKTLNKFEKFVAASFSLRH